MTNKTTDIIVFTGGGTGGHIYPNLALIPEFEKRGFKAVYIGGDGKTMERRLARENAVKYYGIPVIKLVRSLSPSAISHNIKIPFTLKRSIDEARKLLEKIKPCAVISKGGFVSLPVVIAASKLNIPTFAHESDLTLGLANKLAMHYGATMLKANPKAEFKGITVGMPLRDSLFSSTKTQAKSKLGISTSKKVLLILGGSSGAQFLNEEVKKHIDELTKKYFVLHVCGRGAFNNDRTNVTNTNDNRAVSCKNTSTNDNAPNDNSDSGTFKSKRTEGAYLSFEYADNIADFYAASDVVVSRAGATAVYEISALKKRAVFVPLPKGVSRGDQIFNAQLAEEYGAFTLCQNERFSDNFLSAIEKALQNPPMRALSSDANGKIADIVCDSIGRGEKCRNKKLSPNGSQLSYS
ncbi:MAG: UDP-N-acetylglucosamine--N-acetylmuramyl-(pentapeptide) pyrophosphoryl-undecaprenol N-acetylglucosamine transferase [Clostridia bacterium]|nr:UDP-N-acetylglucosamine--N-acetylmuramyl-(pentapeptide) pyrophosphoryl-undecaprenol N-acetylglucosamine transferase [Clostridia bacterium]